MTHNGPRGAQVNQPDGVVSLAHTRQTMQIEDFAVQRNL